MVPCDGFVIWPITVVYKSPARIVCRAGFFFANQPSSQIVLTVTKFVSSLRTMSDLELHSDTFKAKLSQPQLWLLRLASRRIRTDMTTEEIRRADDHGVFSRAVISYSIKALAKRGLLRTENEERKISRIQITAAGRKLLRTITS